MATASRFKRIERRIKKMNTKRSSLLCLLVSLFAFIAVLSFRAEAQTGPGRQTKAEGDIDPFEVTLYQSSNYANPIMSLKLASGMRMLKVSKVDKIPLSLLLGSKVGVVLFPNLDLSSKTYRMSSYTDDGSGSKVNPKFYLLGYFRFKGSTPDTGMGGIIHGPCSLIIHRKDISDYLGVYLESITSNELGQSGSWGQFYPLPDEANNSTIIHHKIPKGDRFKLQYMAGGLGAQSLFPSTTPPYPENMAVTITSPHSTLKLPEPKPQTIEWQLDKHGIVQISSITMQYKGPIQGDAYLLPKAVRAPAAPTVAKAPAASDLEKGFDRPGSDYKHFPLDGGPEECQQACTSDPNCKAFTWVQPGVQGPKARCWLKSVVPSAVSNANCVSGVKTALATGPISSSSPAPSQTSMANIAGTWQSSIGLVYDIRQREEQFGWTVANSDEKGRGTCQGAAVSATWSSSSGKGTAKGKITQVDPSGKAMRIEWDNGVVFFR
jgi:hypothetical protein